MAISELQLPPGVRACTYDAAGPMAQALAGPFAGVRFCPTGGITADNLQRYMAQPNVMCVGGTWMFQREWVQNSDWARIQQCSAESLQLLD
ncbi:hypothetical protein [uncultured Pseudomonas sp.]|uniref:hypothetical protein n=1 Tax=uncultured Pseudomonas sp. TaxID=114707 RepID=UPI0025E6C692|nr:hypothetical protein [uncultured Pseudomonas sp.]